MNHSNTVDDEACGARGEMASTIDGPPQSSIAADVRLSVLSVVVTPCHKTRVSASDAQDKSVFKFPGTNFQISALAREGSAATWSSIAACVSPQLM